MKDARVVLVPTDFSAVSLEALEPAIKLVEHDKGVLHLLHVLEDTEPLGAPDSEAASTLMRDGLIADAKREFSRLLPRLRGVEHRFAIRPQPHGAMQAPAVDAILAYAQEAGVDIIVMATHGRRGITRAILGSTTEGVVRRASCPVLTIRSRDGAVGALTASATHAT